MEEKVGFFKRLKNGLSKTRDSFVSGIDSLFTGFSEIDVYKRQFQERGNQNGFGTMYYI